MYIRIGSANVPILKHMYRIVQSHIFPLLPLYFFFFGKDNFAVFRFPFCPFSTGKKGPICVCVCTFIYFCTPIVWLDRLSRLGLDTSSTPDRGDRVNSLSAAVPATTPLVFRTDQDHDRWQKCEALSRRRREEEKVLAWLDVSLHDDDSPGPHPRLPAPRSPGDRVGSVQDGLPGVQMTKKRAVVDCLEIECETRSNPVDGEEEVKKHRTNRRDESGWTVGMLSHSDRRR